MTAPEARAKRATGPWLAGLVLLLAVIVGGLGGIALDRHVLLPRMFHHGDFDHGPGPHPPRDRDFRRRFANELGLTEEQQTLVDSIMDRQGRELRAVRGKVQPEVDSIITRTRRQLDSVLTPDQRKKAEEMRRRHPRPPGPPPGEFGPEGPPPGPR
jgi:Spy/CpxP family protein refolding chaperone